jgi:hypothetical protein
MADLKFEILTLAEFEKWLIAQPVIRAVDRVQNHHTWKPSYTNFNGRNHKALIEGMHRYHTANGWSMLGQHFTTFEDGKIGTGRPLNQAPACISYSNQGAICIEHLGNFDKGGDMMTKAHRDTIVAMNALLCLKFNLFASMDSIVYHHWYSPTDGKFIGNNNNVQKTCPGTNFFGGNTTEAAQAYFIPPIRQKITEINMPARAKIDISGARQGLVMSTTPLNVRTAPSTDGRAIDSLASGTIVWIFAEKDGWYKVDRLRERWVRASFVRIRPATTPTAPVPNRPTPSVKPRGTGSSDIKTIPEMTTVPNLHLTDADILDLYFDLT